MAVRNSLLLVVRASIKELDGVNGQRLAWIAGFRISILVFCLVSLGMPIVVYACIFCEFQQVGLAGWLKHGEPDEQLQS